MPILHSNLYWEDGLREYLSASNEDETILNYFERALRAFSNRADIQNKIGWLEIGPGPFTKTGKMLELIAQYCGHSSIKLYLVEPSDYWNSELPSYLPSIGTSFSIEIETFSGTIEAFVQQRLKKDELWFDFITANHVIYSHDATMELLNLIDFVEQVKLRPCLVFLSVESPNSDFAKIRILLNQKLRLQLPGSEIRFFLENIAQKGFMPEVIETREKVCQIKMDELSSENFWFYPFIYGCDKSSFHALPIDLKRQTISIVSEYVSQLNSDTLYVPDIICYFKIQ